MLSETRLQGVFTLSGVSTSLRPFFARNAGNECHGDSSRPAIELGELIR